ncbi:hypothetical protein CCR75_004656 [Bremia lactucae]|uniref:SWIM-type domain-containing protein n=1 Tax=Bremia lactucae TaxID=4779 RepID=A0A976IGS3_BRELC|nr:hypothetical protein CCR75_004656 [Bremia lactucae]
MTSALGVSVLSLVMSEVKQSKEKQFTDRHGDMLASLPQEDLKLVEAASELVERGLVVRITATPSRREFYRVESRNKYKRNGSYHDVNRSVDSGSNSFDATTIRGSGASYYNCFSHYCTCAAFHDTVVKSHPTAMCKHILARLLADATGQFQSMQVEDLHFAQMLSGSMSEIEKKKSEGPRLSLIVRSGPLGIGAYNNVVASRTY